MLRLHKDKKAQNTAEYAILIALVIGAVVAMQTYAQRALQGRIRDVSVELVSKTTHLGCSLQYEPYYLNQRTLTDKSSTDDDTWEQQTRSLISRKSSQSIDRTDYVNSVVPRDKITVGAADAGM